MFEINCFICGKNTKNRERIFLSNRLIVCNKCYKQHNGFICHNCQGNYIDFNYNTKHKCCSYCAQGIQHYKKQEKIRIHNYYFKPYPTFFRLKKSEQPFYMGIELQIGGVQKCDTVNKFAAFNESNFCYIKKDTSIPIYGCQVVSYPATLKYHLSSKSNWKKLLENAKKLKFKSYNIENCGIHIHVNKNYFNPYEIQKLDYFINNNQDFFIALSKRQSNYSRFLHKPIDLYGTPINYNRNCALNLCNQNTIEFRMFKGTLNYRSFISYIELVYYISHYIKQTQLKQLNTFSFLQYVNLSKTKYLQNFINKNIHGDKNGNSNI